MASKSTLSTLLRGISLSEEQSPPVDVAIKVLLSTSGQAPSPNKDFYQFLVKPDEVIWRVWRIVLRPSSRFDRPTQLTQSHNDFLNDVTLHEYIRGAFGESILKKALALCKPAQKDFISCLPQHIAQHVISFLKPGDIEHLSQVSHHFQELCSMKEV